MKTMLKMIVLLMATAGVLAAEVPRKPLPSKYRGLWTDSPFTAKPVATTGPVYNALQDYVLIGVGPAEEGHRVTLLNSKRPNDGRFIVKSGKPNKKGIMIDRVIRENDGPRSTKVRIKDNSGNVAEVGFDRKFLAIKAPAPAATPRPGFPQRGSTSKPGTNKPNGQAQQRVPRRRIIPNKPSTPGAQNNRSSSNQGNQGGTQQNSLQRLRNAPTR